MLQFNNTLISTSFSLYDFLSLSFIMSRMIDPLAVGRVIGEVVDSFTPSVKLNVTYNLNKTVSNGHELMPNLITSKPQVHIGGVDMRSSYTIVILVLFEF